MIGFGVLIVGLGFEIMGRLMIIGFGVNVVMGFFIGFILVVGSCGGLGWG